MVLLSLVTRGFLATLLVLYAGAAAAESVYWNYGIGAIQTGWSYQYDGPIGVKTHIVGIGPDDASPKLQHCIEEATKLAGRTTQQPLDRHIEDMTMVLGRLFAGDTPLTQALLDKEMKEQTDRTNQLMLFVIGVYEFNVETCMEGLPYDADAIRLGLVTRVCASWFETVERCMRPRDPVTREQDPGTGRFAKLQEWLASRNLQRPINEMIQLVPEGKLAVNIAPDLRDRTYYRQPSAEVAALYFEAGVNRLRQNGWQYDYTAPKAFGIDQSIVIALADVVASQVLAVPGLKNEGRRLRSASSDIVRNRIRECALFRGQTGFEEIAACAGVVNEATVIRSCIAGTECRPGLGKDINAWALTINTIGESVNLSSPLPRILLESMPAQEQFRAAKVCAEKSATNAEFSLCFTESQLLDDRSRQALQCARKTGKSERIDCMLSSIGGEEAKKAACILKATGNAALARCLVSEDTPEEVAEALECASQPGASYESIGSCLVSKSIPGEAGRLIGCAGSAGGDPMGAAICVAGDGLSPEQRILLQCAAQSADLSSYGVCVGGQLALKEFANCKNKNFAEGSCFGENNEIRKFVRNIGLGDISENSVVAQMLNAQLDLVKFNVRVAEGLVEGINKLGEEAGKFLDDIVTTRFALFEGDSCENMPAGLERSLCEEMFRQLKPPIFDLVVSIANDPVSVLAQVSGKDVTEIDTSRITLTVDPNGVSSLSDGTTSVTINTDGDTQSQADNGTLDQALSGSGSQGLQAVSENGVNFRLNYKGATADSVLGSAIAKPLYFGETNMSVINSLDLKFEGSSDVKERLQMKQMQFDQFRLR